MAKFFSFLGSLLEGLLMVVVFYNPVSFLVWSFVAPKKAAAIMVTKDDDSKVMRFLSNLHKPLTHLYPMYIKKHFMKALGMRNYSANAQVKAFRALNESDVPAKAVKLVEQMSDVAVSKLWDDNMLRHRSYNPVITYAVTESGKSLMTRQLKVLFEREDYDSFGNYAKNHTLSKAALELLIERMEQKSEQKSEDKESFDKLQDVLFSQIEKNGLPANLVEKAVKACGQNQLAITKSFEVFRQKTLVLSRDYKAFSELVKYKKLAPSVEALMDREQYNSYLEAGNHLSDEAIREFIARENMAICDLIFKNEKLSAVAVLMAEANPKFALKLPAGISLISKC